MEASLNLLDQFLFVSIIGKQYKNSLAHRAYPTFLEGRGKNIMNGLLDCFLATIFVRNATYFSFHQNVILEHMRRRTPVARHLLHVSA